MAVPRMWIVIGIGVLFLVQMSDGYLTTSFKGIYEIPCDQKLHGFKTAAETVILPCCLDARGHWASYLRAQNPWTQIYLGQSSDDEMEENQDITGLVLKTFTQADVEIHREKRPSLRLMVELEEERVMDDLIQAGSFKTNDVILLRDPSLLADEGFMMKLAGLYFQKGVLWTILCQDLDQEEAERYSKLVWKWAHNGCAGIDFRWRQQVPSVSSLVRPANLSGELKKSLETLLGRQVAEAYEFDTFPFRYMNELGVPESLPGRLGPDYGPAILAVIDPRPHWPHRLAYHGFQNATNFQSIRKDGWKLKGCQRRCYYGKGVYTSPSFIVAARHYGCTLQFSNGRFYRVGLQVALRNEQMHPSSYGHRQHDPQWQDFATHTWALRGDAPELLVPDPEDVQIVGFVFSEIIFSSFLPKRPALYTGHLS